MMILLHHQYALLAVVLQKKRSAKESARHPCSIQLRCASCFSLMFIIQGPGVSHLARYLASCGIEFSSPVKPIYESGRTRMIEGELPSLSVKCLCSRGLHGRDLIPLNKIAP